MLKYKTIILFSAISAFGILKGAKYSGNLIKNRILKNNGYYTTAYVMKTQNRSISRHESISMATLQFDVGNREIRKKIVNKYSLITADTLYITASKKYPHILRIEHIKK